MMRSPGLGVRILALGIAISSGVVAVKPASAAYLLYNNPSAWDTNGSTLGGRPESDGSASSQGRLETEWSGRYELRRTSGDLLFGEVEYAVFRESVFAALYPTATTPNGSLADGNVGPNNGFVYAFRVRDNGATAQGIAQITFGLADLGTTPLDSSFGWGDGTFDNEGVVEGDENYVVSTGTSPSGPTPMSVQPLVPGPFGASSVKFTFDPTLKGTMGDPDSGWSAILFYTSPYGPRWDNAGSTGGGGTGKSAPVPAPEVGIPEPTSLSLCAMAIAAILAGCRRRAV